MPATAYRHLLLGASLAACLLGVAVPAGAQSGRYGQGDRVEVKRGAEWQAGTVIGAAGSRLRVRLDGDGLAAGLPADIREKRLTRNFYLSDVRPLRHPKGRPAASAPSTPPVQNRSASQGDSSLRNWSDRTGRFSIDAVFRGLNGQKVVLEKPDGSRIEVPLDKLSDADQQFVESQGGDPENPFAVAATVPAGYEPAPLRPNKSQMQTIQPQTFDAWEFSPEPGIDSIVNAQPRNIPLGTIPDSDLFFEKVQQIDVSSDGQRGMLVRAQGKVGRGKDMYVELVDLAAGRSLALVALPRDVKVLAVDLDTGRIAYREDEFHGSDEELILGRIDGSNITTVAKWEPYGDADWEPRKEVEAAWFLEGGKLLTLNAHGESLIVWNPTTAEAITQIPVGVAFRADDLALSPDRRYACIKMRSGLAIIDLTSGQHVATVDLGDQAAVHVHSLAISPDNRKLLACAFDEIVVWDLTTGEVSGVMAHSTYFPSHQTVWAGNFLFHGNQYVYDYHRKILLWELEGIAWHSGQTLFKNGMLCIVPETKRRQAATFKTMPFPNPQMLAMADKLGSPESLVVAKAGDPVSLELDIDENVISTEAVRSAVIANLEKAGYRVEPNSKTVVSAVCKQLPAQTIKINTGSHRFRAKPEDIVERTIVPHPTALTMSYEGKQVWRRANMGRPGMTIWLNRGESLDDALTRITTPNTKLLTETEFPKEVIRPGDATSNGAYGVTNVGTGMGGSSTRFE